MEITLTDDQYTELAGIILANYYESMYVLNEAIYDFWTKTLGYRPKRVDRIQGRTFEITNKGKAYA